MALRKARVKQGYLGERVWSRQDVASRAGICLSAYHNIETGQSSASIETLEAIAAVFDLSLCDLLC